MLGYPQHSLKYFLLIGILIVVGELVMILVISRFFCKLTVNRIQKLNDYLRITAGGKKMELEKDRFQDEITELSQSIVELFQRMANSRGELEDNCQKLAQTNQKLESNYIQSYNLQLIQEEISRELEIDKLVKKTADIIMGLFGSKRCLIYMADEESGTLNAVAYSGSMGKDTPNKTIAFDSDNMIARSWREKMILTEKDATPEELALLHKRNIKSVLTVPLIGRQGRVGIMALEHDVALPKGTSNESVKFARVVAQELSLSVENAYLYEKMRQMAIRDALTGAYNRLYLMDYMAEIFANNPQMVSVLIFDMDHFKQVNDKFGHLSGDMVLRTTAVLIQKMLPSGILARYGGEEFVIVLPEVNQEEAVHFANSIRQIIGHHKFLVADGESISVTLSIGVACYPLVSNSYEGLLQLADGALYEAKNSGRNKVCVATPKAETAH
jgi:diguanylate cyclase (GGDEF)-like protein